LFVSHLAVIASWQYCYAVRMNLICFPSRDVLHDLILPLHLRPAKVWVMSVQGCQPQTEHLMSLLRAHDIAHVSIGLPPLPQCDDPAELLHQRLQQPLAAATETPLVLAVGASIDLWEHYSLCFLRAMLAPQQYQVLALAQDGRTLLTLAPETVRQQTLPNLLTSRDYLSACHATLRSSASQAGDHAHGVAQRRTTTLLLARQCQQLGKHLGTLNYLARAALDRDTDALVAPRQKIEQARSETLHELLLQLAANGLLDYVASEQTVYFHSAAGCAYLAGGWLEEYAWLTATELGADEVHAGLELTWNAGKGISPRNELDLFILQHNRALTVECKTAYMGAGDTTAKILYKLDSIADRLSRLPGNAVLLSAREVPELMRKRAQAQGVGLFDAGRLIQFRHWLAEWLRI